MLTLLLRPIGCISVIGLLLTFPVEAIAQCTWYTISMEDTDGASEVTWELIDDMGVTWTSGGAPFEEDICLPDGCYTLLMYDSAGNGWEDEDWVIEDWIGDFDFDTNLDDGFHGNDLLDLGDSGCVDTTDPTACPDGSDLYNVTVTSGSDPGDITWSISDGAVNMIGGAAPADIDFCMGDGCFFVNLYDDESDGWEGATITITDDGGTVVLTTTLSSGDEANELLNIGGQDCSGETSGGTDPGGGGGGGGGDCGSEQPSGDCVNAPCVCDPYTFNITASGWGSTYEIPAAGSTSNPSYGPLNNAPWGGTDYGCLLAGELNSSWMMFTMSTSGTLEFSFGAGGEQSGYYDWAMWSYSDLTTCDDIANDAVSPVRCTWNAVSWGGTGLATSIPTGGNAGNYGPALTVTAGDQFIICLSNWSYVSDEVTLDFFGTADVDCNLFLPVEFFSFTAVQRSLMVELNWQTLQEIDNDHFDVQRSTDMHNWTTIETVEGKEESFTISDYQCFDLEPELGSNYYRIKQVDQNGAYKFTHVEVVDFHGDDIFEVYPNPASDVLRIIHESGKGQRLIITDAGGRIVLEYETSILPSEVYVGDLASGVYFVILELPNGELMSKRLLIGS